MECPACPQANREDARFCPKCGALLSSDCPSCGRESTTAAGFCDSCVQGIKAGAETESDMA